MKQLTKHLALSAGLLVALASCSPKLSKQKSAALTTRQDSVAYAFGVLNGQAFSEVLSRMPGDTLSRQQILAAFGDVLLGHSTKVSASAAKAIFDEYAAGLQQAETRRTAASADSVLAANKAKEGVKVTEIIHHRRTAMKRAVCSTACSVPHRARALWHRIRSSSTTRGRSPRGRSSTAPTSVVSPPSSPSLRSSLAGRKVSV